MSGNSIEARPNLKDAGLDFARFGYFTRPLPSSEGDAAWGRLEALLGKIKSGNFSATEALLSLSRESSDWRLRYVATRVLGHAGTVTCFKRMREELEQHPLRKQELVDVPSRELVAIYCRAFALWGRLDVVPVLMDQYLTLRLKKTPEIATIPLLLADLLVDDENTMIAHEPPEDLLEDYLNLVMNQYEALVSRLGSDKVFVFRGELSSVRAIAERMRHLTTRYRASELGILRERFEPATGIDCSAVFQGDGVSSLAAAAIAESFLESSDARKFRPGVRYFFGHPIPD